METKAINHPKILQSLLNVYKAAVDFTQFPQQPTMSRLVLMTKAAQTTIKEYSGIKPMITLDAETSIVSDTTSTITEAPSLTALTTTPQPV